MNYTIEVEFEDQNGGENYDKNVEVECGYEGDALVDWNWSKADFTDFENTQIAKLNLKEEMQTQHNITFSEPSDGSEDFAMYRRQMASGAF